MSIKVTLPSITLPNCAGDVITVKTNMGEVPHTLNSRGQLIPLGIHSGHHQPSPIDWERERIKAARAALQGIISAPDYYGDSATVNAKYAVHYADALIAELQKEVAK